MQLTVEFFSMDHALRSKEESIKLRGLLVAAGFFTVSI